MGSRASVALPELNVKAAYPAMYARLFCSLVTFTPQVYVVKCLLYSFSSTVMNKRGRC